MYRLIIFDLDFTLWNAGGKKCKESMPPYKKLDDFIEDAAGLKIKLYQGVKELLQELHNKKIQMAVASKTDNPPISLELMKLFDIDRYFVAAELYPGSKAVHVDKIHQLTGVDYADMLFFDDEMVNVKDVDAQGVQSFCVDNGVTPELVKKALLMK